jgi:nucleoid-associated protein YgaU
MFDSVLDSEQAFDTLRTMARTRVRRRRTVLFVSLGLIGAAWAGPVASALNRSPEVRNVSRSSYVVRSGDSVWDIAQRISPGTDPRPLVDAIVETNDLDPSALTPGQTLVIPTG